MPTEARTHAEGAFEIHLASGPQAPQGGEAERLGPGQELEVPFAKLGHGQANAINRHRIPEAQLVIGDHIGRD